MSVGCQESFNKQPSPLHAPALAIRGSVSDISSRLYITLTLSQHRPLGSNAFALIKRVNPQTADTASISLPRCGGQSRKEMPSFNSIYCLIYISRAAGRSPHCPERPPAVLSLQATSPLGLSLSRSETSIKFRPSLQALKSVH